MTEVFVYLRVSGKGQLSGDGLSRQFRNCRRYAQANDLKIVKIFREKGVSGKNELADRPALSGLFAALEADGVKTILIEKLDRLARLLMVQESIVADVKRKGYLLLSSCEPGLCDDDPARVVIRQILGAFAQYERAMIEIRLREARQTVKLHKGKCEGRKAFGERPGETEILARMSTLRACGSTYAEIAGLMNAHRLPSRTGAAWSEATVSKILRRQPSVTAPSPCSPPADQPCAAVPA